MKAMLLLMTGLCFAATVSIQVARAGDMKDVAGSKDHPLIKRYDGAVIASYEHKEFDEYLFPLGKEIKDGKFLSAKVIEGEVTRLGYVIPAGRSTLEIMRNYETDMKAMQYTTLFTGAKEEMRHFGSAAGWPMYAPVKDETIRVMVAKLARPGKPEAHVVLYIFEALFGGGWAPNKGDIVVVAHVITDKAMETSKLLQIGAEEMASSISDTGRVALYGIYFDTNKTEVKTESDPMLQEMAKLLKNNPALKLFVVGHTDNTGTFSSNMELSHRRAQAVVNALVSKHAVAKDRLMPIGVSFAAPVAPNKTEEGRAKNRRVELVEQ